MTRQGRPDHIAELDALRGLMSLWVVLGHALHAVGFPGGDPLWVKPFLANGLAVDVFIILSGFVVTRLLDEKRESYGVYITRRFFRLFPAYVACLLLSVFMLDLVVEALRASPFPSPRTDFRVAVTDESRAHLWPHLAAHLAMLHGLLPKGVLPHSDFAILGQAWSISVEWQFYLLVPFVVGVISAQRFAALAAWIIAAVVVQTVVSRGFGLAFVGGFLSEFAVGMASYYAWKVRARWVPLVPAALVLPVAVGSAATLSANPVPYVIWSAVFALLLLDRTHPDRSGLAWLPVRAGVRILQSSPLAALGAVSYSLYLCHMIVLYAAMAAIGSVISDPLPYMLAIATTTVTGSLLFSWLLYHAVERPGMAFGKRITGRHG